MSNRPRHRYRRRRTFSGFRKSLVEFVIVLAVSFALVFGFVKPVVADSFYIPSESMVPTLQVWDRIFVDKLSGDFTDPNRGDILVFENPDRSSEDRNLIKRVVGLPGDTVELREGVLYLNGEAQVEPYINSGACQPYRPKTCDFGSVTVPEDHVFMMGDNRANSTDSRFFGAIPKEDIVGRAVVRFWPPGRVGGV